MDERKERACIALFIEVMINSSRFEVKPSGSSTVHCLCWRVCLEYAADSSNF
jgi:hypothetical protein